uniref:GST N-terminal domain-containing protein n=1 Tax=Rhinopithecus bieti TaxID=61621 RepID=A0A2K6KB18_RHIBE
MPMILGYWDIRGLAHAIRLLLEYTDSNYEEKKYLMGHGKGTFVSGPCPHPLSWHQATHGGHLWLPLQASPAGAAGCPFPEPLH